MLFALTSLLSGAIVVIPLFRGLLARKILCARTTQTNVIDSFFDPVAFTSSSSVSSSTTGTTALRSTTCTALLVYKPSAAPSTDKTSQSERNHHKIQHTVRRHQSVMAFLLVIRTPVLLGRRRPTTTTTIIVMMACCYSLLATTMAKTTRRRIPFLGCCNALLLSSRNHHHHHHNFISSSSSSSRMRRHHQQRSSSSVNQITFRQSSSSTQLQQHSDTTTTATTIHPSFNDDIIDLYDAFILDQFGVLHNGVHALEGAIELCEYLYKRGKKLIILSNTSAPSTNALQKLTTKLGFEATHFVDAVTSGEEASRYIRQTYADDSGTDDSTPITTTKVLMITWDVYAENSPRLSALPEQFLEQCSSSTNHNIKLATSVDEADLLLLHGSEVWYRGPTQPQISLSSFIDHGEFHDVDPILQQCASLKIPAVCANPDIIVQTPAGDGGVSYMPGGLAERYVTKFGGQCRTFGKPSVDHFEACLRKLGNHNISKHRVAHVGDSLHHDISGAMAAGIPNIFVTSGIHRQQFGTQFGELPGEDILNQVLEEEGNIQPTHIVPAFRL